MNIKYQSILDKVAPGGRGDKKTRVPAALLVALAFAIIGAIIIGLSSAAPGTPGTSHR